MKKVLYFFRGHWLALLGLVLAAVDVRFFYWLGTWRCNTPVGIMSFGSFFYYGLFCILLPILIFMFFVLLDLDVLDDLMKLLWIPVIIFVIVMLVGMGKSALMFNAKQYAAQISVPQATPFDEHDIAPFDSTQIPWVSEDYAEVLGDKLIGTLGAVGSSVSLGEYVRQEVNGKLYFVAPILHSSYFKWKANKDGTAGYVMVSMTDDNDVQLIDDYKIKIQPSGHAAYEDKLERIVYNVLPDSLRYGYKFEVDDNLHPWWVVQIYENQIGWWGGKEITKAVLVDATDGSNIFVYDDLSEVPEWVDRIYPSSLIEEQITNWGLFSGGFKNRWFDGTNLLRSDKGNTVVYSDDDCYLFDSLTSDGADESTVGFILTNLRTKETQYFSLAGATEKAACKSAVGDERVKAQDYSAIFPTPTMIEGQPTYFIPLADSNSHLIKAFALVNIQRHHVVGIGTTIRDAERDYRAKLREEDPTTPYSSTADLQEITGKIVRWGSYIENGSTYYLFVVEGHEEVLFLTDTSFSETVITKEGDRVKLTVTATENQDWTVFSFDNLEFEQAPRENSTSQQTQPEQP